MAYKLKLPPYSRVHPIFHVSCIKKVIGDKIPIHTILPEIDEEGKLILIHEMIIERSIKKLQIETIIEYLMKWKNLSIESTTWEEEFLM